MSRITQLKRASLLLMGRTKMNGIKRLIAVGMSAILTMAMLPMSTTSTQAANTKATTISNPYIKDGAVVYDCVYFGNYWQNDTNRDGKANKKDEKSPIKWRVLSVNGSTALLLADQVLDCQKYYHRSRVTWSICTMRSWLNYTFMMNAFTSNEQKAIKATTIANKDNQLWGTEGGVDTKDCVFLLSLEDMANMKYGFSNFDFTNWNGEPIAEIDDEVIYDYAKLRTLTAFASGPDSATGCTLMNSIGYNYWWLRSPGSSRYRAAEVGYYGGISRSGGDIVDRGTGVVPALYLNLSSTSTYTYAGTVTCDRNGIKYNEKATGNGGSGSYTVKAATEAETVAISKTMATLTVGKTLTLKMSGTTDTVKWTSSDSKIAKVDSEGKVTAVKAGTATITATVGGKKYSCEVTVTKAPTTISNPYVKDGAVVYDCVYFGNYWQNDTNGDGKANKQDEKSPIKWRVLSVDGSKALLVADQVLDVQHYNDTSTDITWADCTMRTWLNGTFKNNAFSGSEQKAIQLTTLVNKDNYGTEGGVNTKDSVFLLSLEDIANTKYGYGNLIGKIGNSKLRTVTAFAGGTDIATGDSLKSSRGDCWWLRSPGYGSNRVAFVYRTGYVFDDGVVVSYDYGVVPALYLNLTSTANYTYAGTVTCDENGITYDKEATGNGGSGSYIVGDPTEPVKISKTKTSIAVGDTLTLEMSGTTSTVKWTSSDNKVAKVDSEGKVTAVTAGEATITAAVGGKKYTCVVTVYPISNPYVKDGVVVYDCVYFGNYWQNDTNGDGKANKQDEKSPIKWRVLSVDGSKALLVADQILDCQRYNATVRSITWADSTMRTWLNDSFKKNAFTSSEQKAIKATTIANKDNQYYGTEGGVNTKDSVFLLSLKDIANTKYGFRNFDLTNWNGDPIGTIDGYGIRDYAKLRTITSFASGLDVAISGYPGRYDIGTSGYSRKSDIGTSGWWLRSPGYYSGYAAYVEDDGFVDLYGSNIYGDIEFIVDYIYGVVPALYLNLSSTSAYTYAGTVMCDGNGIIYNETATGNGGSGSYTVKTATETENVTISKTKATLNVGKTLTLKMSGTTDTVKWTSGNSKIAKVDSKGKVTAVKAGKATITATVGGKKYTCAVTVTK